jgi:hypothetical protein
MPNQERKHPVKPLNFLASANLCDPSTPRSTRFGQSLFRWLPVIVGTAGTALAVTLSISLSLPAHGAAPTPGAGAVRVTTANIIDYGGFEKPLVAASMFVPAGWPTQSEVLWNMNLECGAAQSLRLRAIAPDGSARFELMPGESWSASNYMGKPDKCQTASFRDAREYLQAWVQRYRPGARLLDFRPRPDRFVAATEQQMPMMVTRIWTDSGQVLIGYAMNGNEMRETVVTDVQFTSIQSTMQGGNGSMGSLMGRSLSIMSWRAPEGKLELRHVDAVIDSLRIGTEWKFRRDKLQLELNDINIRVGREIGGINAKTGMDAVTAIAQRGREATKARAELTEINAATYRATQASIDRQHVETIKSIRGVENYRQPNGGGVVELSNLYRHAWQLKDGSYALTDNPNFNPTLELGVGGQEMARTR